MNVTQKKIVLSASVIVVAMLFFPPFKLEPVFALSGFSKGYEFIGDAPVGAHINWALLLVQWSGVIFLAGILYFLCKEEW